MPHKLCNMAFLTDISISIDEADYPDAGTLRSLLRGFSAEKEGSCYRVGGSFEDLDRLSIRLHHMCPQASAQLRPLHVSSFVMTYIEEKCARKLKEIGGNMCVIETVPNPKTDHGTPNCTIQVSFRPIQPFTRPVRADFVRQRFISLYQRTASDLQVISVPRTDGYRNLERRFPLLLFRQKNKCEVTVIGPYGNIAKLQEFLSQSRQSPTQCPTLPGTADSPSSRRVGASPPHRDGADSESCPICMEPIVTEEKETLRCGHSFCRSCLRTAFDYKPVCPTCGRIYGAVTGTQPDGGEMDVTRSSSSLPGYEKYGTIVIHYYIPSGIQKAEHPNPGQPYTGASRRAYLPDSSQGRAVLELLRRAFKQRLVFTVGRSTTSGSNNVVTWNDIHHKTSTHGGPTRYGYPDPDYLNRIQEELAAKGIE